MFENIHHIGIVVRDLDQALKLYEGIYGIEPSLVYESPGAKSKIAFFPVGECRVELIQPLDDDSAAGKFLRKRGEGIHHIAFAVKDIDKCLNKLAMEGVQLIDKKSRKVREDERVAFLNPKSTNGVLTELVQ